jgi:hypothetical protein
VTSRLCRAVLLVFGGVWLGHMLEHFRVEGPAGLVHELHHSVHLYMIPLGLVLLILAMLVGLAWTRLHGLLSARADRASTGLQLAWQGKQLDPPADPARAPDPPRSWVWVTLPLALAQLALYGTQEHIEHALAGHRASALEIFGGAHWAAALIQVGVACLLAAIVVRCRGRVVDLSRRIEAVERLTHWLSRLRTFIPPAAARHRTRSFTPRERFGGQLLQRPPPSLHISH